MKFIPFVPLVVLSFIACTPNKNNTESESIQKETLMGLKLYMPLSEFYKTLDSLSQMEMPKVQFQLMVDRVNKKLSKAPYIQFYKELDETFYGFVFADSDYGIVKSIYIQLVDDLSDRIALQEALESNNAHLWKNQQTVSFAYLSLMNQLNEKYGNDYVEKESKGVLDSNYVNYKMVWYKDETTGEYHVRKELIADTTLLTHEMIWHKDGLNISLIRKYKSVSSSSATPSEDHRTQLIEVKYSLSDDFKKAHLKEINEILSQQIDVF
jgi:hypothetical protein